jgi:hypothetical protein
MRKLGVCVLLGAVVVACGSRSDLVGSGSGPFDGGLALALPGATRDAATAQASAADDAGSHLVPGASCATTGPGPVTITKGPQGSEQIVVDANNVYWAATQVSSGFTGGVFGEVMQCAKCGCRSPIVLTNDIPQGIAVDSAYVYWVSSNGIMRVPIGGGPQTTFTSTQAIGGIAIDATNVYWSNGNNAVMTSPRDGGSPTVVAVAPATATVLAVDATNVYWVDTPSGTVAKAPVGGGVATVLATGQSASSLALDATNVYWTNYNNDGPGATVMTIPISGGTPTILASGIRGPWGIAVGRSSVYWTSDNAVKQLPIGGGPATTVLPSDAFSGPFAIAVDETNVYWTDVIAGTVMRLTQD